MNYAISVIMPALNEEDNIARAVEDVVEALNRLRISGELIVVNDGSTDQTEVIVNSLIEKYPFISMINHDKPKGIGTSFWDGVWKSRSEIVTLLPGDGEGNAYEILCYLPLMDYVDLIIPFVYNTNVRPLLRRIISKVFTGIINLSFGTSLNYTNGFVIYRKCLLKNISLKDAGFFYQTELLIKCLKRGYLYAEVPVALSQRIGGKSKGLTFKSIYTVIISYFSTIFAIYSPGKRDGYIAPDSVTAVRWEQLKENEESRNSLKK